MPRTEEANQRVRGERRRHILDVSVLVFARQGLAATKIADIAAAGEMSQGLIYRYFTSKEEIYAAVLERAMQSTLKTGREALEREGTPLEKLRWLLQYVISGLWSRSEFALVVQDMLMNQTMPQEIRTPALEQAIAFQQIIYRLIAEAQAAGQASSSTDPVMLTMLVGACIQGLTTQKMYLPDAPAPDPEIILRMLKA
jgi:AcrR family transcriptional regulator